jgi:uncharacterized membrane protein
MRLKTVQDEYRAPSPTWGNRANREPRWPASVALAIAIVLYVLLPDHLIYGFGLQSAYARWIVPALEAALLIPLQVTGLHHESEEAPWRRYTSLALIGLVNIANIGSLILLVNELVHSKIHLHGTLGAELIYSSILIWFTNVIIFALWYWELDRGGPGARCRPEHREPDFLFPQMLNPRLAEPHWTPNFFDYLYVSFTNATAFSPTDTMPLTETSKVLMVIQSLASLLIVSLVAARAVNILGT